MNERTLSSTEDLIEKMEQNWFISEATKIVVKIHRLHHFHLTELDSVIKASQLTIAEFNVLMSLRRQPAQRPLTPKALAHDLLFSTGGLTKVINKLVHKDLIVTADNVNDQRSKRLSLTNKGRLLVEGLYEKLNQTRQQNVSPLSDEEQSELNRLLSKLIK